MAKEFRTTTFQISHTQYRKVKMICLLTNMPMAEFIRQALHDKLLSVKVGDDPSKKKE